MKLQALKFKIDRIKAQIKFAVTESNRTNLAAYGLQLTHQYLELCGYHCQSEFPNGSKSFRKCPECGEPMQVSIQVNKEHFYTREKCYSCVNAKNKVSKNLF